MKPPTLTAPVQFLAFLLAGWISRRQQLAIGYLRAENLVLRERLGSSRLRFTDGERRLLAEKAEPLGRGALAELATLATPETILRWYRQLVAAKYGAAKQRRSPGRPATERDVTEQLLTMARENASWGYTRLRGAMHDLGFNVARSTIQALLKQNGIEPAPRRGFVGSIKAECLRHIVPLGERHLRTVLREYVEHYHHERNHQGLDNVIPLPLTPAGTGIVRRHERLGGLLSHYRRAAA